MSTQLQSAFYLKLKKDFHWQTRPLAPKKPEKLETPHLNNDAHRLRLQEPQHHRLVCAARAPGYPPTSTSRRLHSKLRTAARSSSSAEQGRKCGTPPVTSRFLQQPWYGRLSGDHLLSSSPSTRTCDVHSRVSTQSHPH